MRFMVIVKASKDSEAGVMPSTELLTAMGKFNEELVKAGVMEAGEGLHPTSKGARIKYRQRAGQRQPRSVRADRRSRRRLLADQDQIARRSDRLDEARAVRRRRRDRNPPGVCGRGFRRSADPRTARAGRAAARAGREEVTLPSFRGMRNRMDLRSRDSGFAAHPGMTTSNKDTHHAIHDADDPPGL